MVVVEWVNLQGTFHLGSSGTPSCTPSWPQGNRRRVVAGGSGGAGGLGPALGPRVLLPAC